MIGGAVNARLEAVVPARVVGATKRYDYAISAAGHRFVAEYKSNASAGSVAPAVPRQSLAYASGFH